MQLFEFEDQPWFPGVLRDGMTAYISWIMQATDMLAVVMPRIRTVVQDTGATRVIDLCAGAGMPTAYVADALAQEGLDVTVHATDLYPNTPALKRRADASAGRMSFDAEPVDATAVPASLTGVRTLFNALHHFQPEVARAVLQDAHDKGQPIVVVETVDRRPANLMGMVGVPLAVWAGTPFFRPLDWRWLVFTYLIPVLPLLVMWDGLVSCLRIYQPPELEDLVAGLDGFDWTIESLPLPMGPVYATVLSGVPRRG